MNIKLYNNNSPNNKIGKSLSSETSYNGTLRDASNVVNPEILIESPLPLNFNYAHIVDFYRYYFIKDIVSYRNGLWLLKLEVDVLESFKTEIKNLSCIIEATEGYEASNYLSESDSWVATVKAKTDIINFSNGLLNNGEYILVTAGG